ncbi:MAG: hypothetical protein HY040_21010 [Planctomycetes bacterium]|nr:hypothetical protein [Planctomycetota bacterium]
MHKILDQLDRDYDRLLWVVVEHFWFPGDNMSYEADEGKITATADGRFYESVRADLRITDVRLLLIKFLRKDPSWRTEIEWKCELSP